MTITVPGVAVANACLSPDSSATGLPAGCADEQPAIDVGAVVGAVVGWGE